MRGADRAIRDARRRRLHAAFRRQRVGGGGGEAPALHPQTRLGYAAPLACMLFQLRFLFNYLFKILIFCLFLTKKVSQNGNFYANNPKSQILGKVILVNELISLILFAAFNKLCAIATNNA